LFSTVSDMSSIIIAAIQVRNWEIKITMYIYRHQITPERQGYPNVVIIGIIKNNHSTAAQGPFYIISYADF